MILGRVNAFRQAIISLLLHGPDGLMETVDAVKDTGFDGYLTVTPKIAARMQFPFLETRTYELGSGDLVDFAIHDSTVLWDTHMQNVAALVTGGGVLVGMSLLTGQTVFVDVVDGGEVRIEPRPRPPD